MLKIISFIFIIQILSNYINFYYKFIYIYNYLSFTEKQKYFDSLISKHLSLQILQSITPPIKKILIFIIFFIYSLIHYNNIKNENIDEILIEKYSNEDNIKERINVIVENRKNKN